MRDRADTPDQLLKLFTKKCYGQEEDRHLAKLQAQTFLEALFGSVEIVMSEGPDYALDRLLKSEHCEPEYYYGKPIYVEVLRKGKSVNFSTQSHDLENEAKIADHRMWTRKMDKYLVGPTLGIGGTATVKLAWNTEERKKVALKILQPKYANSAAKEIKILKELKHENIVRVYDCYDNVHWNDQRTTVFAIEYANQGELIEYLMYTSKFEDDLARWFFKSLTNGIEYCHKMKVIHRDLKHDNCLLGENFVIKITDFGFATHYYKDEELMKTAIGTAQYAAPEILAGKKYNEKVDIFSMGVMLFIALAGSQPWRKASPKSDRWYRYVHSNKWDAFFSYHERSHQFSSSQKTILKGILEPNPTYRWSLNEVKRCKWYNGKTISQNEVESRLRKRKAEVDAKKFDAMNSVNKRTRKAIDIFSQERPEVYFKPAPWLSFVTIWKAEWVLEEVRDAIIRLKGTVIESKEDKEKYKLSFQVKRRVDTGMVKVDEEKKEDKEKNQNKTVKKKNERIYEKLTIRASVQMWLKPGQERALADREKVLAALKRKKEKRLALTKEETEALEKYPIKCYAIFMAEGGGVKKYHFPKIYGDILKNLPCDIIAKDAMLDVD